MLPTDRRIEDGGVDRVQTFPSPVPIPVIRKISVALATDVVFKLEDFSCGAANETPQLRFRHLQPAAARSPLRKVTVCAPPLRKVSEEPARAVPLKVTLSR